MSEDGRPLIWFALPRLDAGGPDRVFSALLHALPADKYRLGVLVQRRGGRYYRALPAHIDVHSIESDARYPVLGARRMLARWRPDIVITSLRMSLTVELARSTMRRPPRQIVRQATPISADFAALRKQSLVKHRFAAWLLGAAWRRADAQIAQSEHMASELRRDAPAAQIIRVIGNPVVVDEATRSGRTTAEDSEPARPHIIAVGRLAPPKGYEVLIAAMARVRASLPDARLTILGDGPLRSALEAQIAASGLTDAVRLAGQSEAVLEEVARADLYVCSSHYEAFSNSTLEAMAVGTPVVATDCPGAMREMIDHGRTGWLCRPGDPDALADAMLSALLKPNPGMTEAAQASVAQRYDIASIAERYASLIDEVLAVADASRSGSPKNRASEISTDRTV